MRQFLGDDLLCIVALDNVKLVRLRIEIVEETLRVKRTAGTRDGNKDSQNDSASSARKI